MKERCGRALQGESAARRDGPQRGPLGRSGVGERCKEECAAAEDRPQVVEYIPLLFLQRAIGMMIEGKFGCAVRAEPPDVCLLVSVKHVYR